MTERYLVACPSRLRKYQSYLATVSLHFREFVEGSEVRKRVMEGTQKDVS